MQSSRCLGCTPSHPRTWPTAIWGAARVLVDILAIFLFAPFTWFVFSRFTKFYENAVIVLLPVYLLCVVAAHSFRQRQTVRGVIALTVAQIIIRRLFVGPYDPFVPSNDVVDLKGKVTIVLMTIEGSDRANGTILWAKSLGSDLIVDRDPPKRKVEFDEIEKTFGWHENCRYFWYQQRSMVYSFRWRKLLERLSTTIQTPWVLILEDDAEPVTHNLSRKLQNIMTYDQDYDFIWLDNRNIWGDFLPIPTIYLGTAGSLVRTEALSRLAGCFKFDENYCWSGIPSAGNDNLLSVCCKSGQVKCRISPCIRESGLPSILQPVGKL